MSHSRQDASEDSLPPQREWDPVLESIERSRSWREWFATIPGFAVSLLVHFVLLFALLFWTLPNPYHALGELIFQPGEAGVSEQFSVFDDAKLIDSDWNKEHVNPQPVSVPSPEIDISQFTDDSSSQALTTEFIDLSSDHGAAQSLISLVGSNYVRDLSGRGEMKSLLVAQNGGSEGSEQAVALGLAWLAEHQNPDGSWSYDFEKCSKCKGKCGNSSRNPSRNSATALALLPFLGSGITPNEGKSEYRIVVAKGLKFLLENSRMDPEGLNFMDVRNVRHHGGMYHQGITATAICEAAAMTGDPKLKMAAQRAADFICYAQILNDGGWRYEPRDHTGGDTSVVGWQIMALQSGRMGGAQIPETVFYRARNFLDTRVATRGGAVYVYQDQEHNKNAPVSESKATTAIGHLCQMYMGRRQDHPGLMRGIELLSEMGPYDDSGLNMYYVYYATQVLHHYGGEPWYKWNRELRDELIDRQSKSGHEKGSWYFPGSYNERGGRLYCTAMTLLTLEVYYRHLPLYQKQSVESEFPLD